MARRVEPQPRGAGGRFAKRTPEPEPSPEHGGEHGESTVASTVASTVEHGDAPVIEYPPPPARSSTAKSTARAGKKRSPRARSSTVKPTVPTVPSTADEPSTAQRERRLGFFDGLTHTVTRG